jgi:hypothetical protein
MCKGRDLKHMKSEGISFSNSACKAAQAQHHASITIDRRCWESQTKKSVLLFFLC